MKKRVKIDSAILSAVILFTALFLLNKGFSLSNRILDIILDFFGFILIFQGAIFRTLARGHKKLFSSAGEKLVTTGPYLLTRNPMYFGSFLLGAGFVLTVWPWWTLPIFVLLFYIRFNRTMLAEEEGLKQKFGSEYAAYAHRTPRIFPSLKKFRKFYLRQIVSVEEALSTNEKRGLIAWPLFALVLDSIQEWFVMGRPDFILNLGILCNAAFVLAFLYWFSYEKA